MKITEKTSLQGEFSLIIKDKHGKTLQAIKEPNLIVSGAKNQLARLIGGNMTNRQITQIGFGTGASAASPDNTGLTNGFFKPVSVVSYPAIGQVAFSWSLSTAEANGLAITEFGLRCADGTLFSRKVRAAINKSDDISIDGTWTIIF
ncbi:hypothetical protein [Thiomicrorhabdus sp.]|uniref:hypothetical protein n=1 Tax=Thiomicrorhabdus sp. TaxID=2039724 RepID=UPI0029C71F22|nr:hypothetical protein [Thiomicrorhabdus sp.]